MVSKWVLQKKNNPKTLDLDCFDIGFHISTNMVASMDLVSQLLGKVWNFAFLFIATSALFYFSSTTKIV